MEDVLIIAYCKFMQMHCLWVIYASYEDMYIFQKYD